MNAVTQRVGSGSVEMLRSESMKRRETMWRRIGTVVSVAVGIGIIAGSVIVLLVWLPSHQAAHVVVVGDNAAKLKADLIDAYRKTLTQIIGGFAVAVGAVAGGYFTWRQVALVRSGQITDRFTKAIAQLGDHNPAVRLGFMRSNESPRTPR